jgi:hypothetical protein
MSAGVKVTLWGPVIAGWAVGVVKANDPGTAAPVIGETAEPPLRVDEASV